MNINSINSVKNVNVSKKTINTKQLSQKMSFKGKLNLSDNTISSFKDSLNKLIFDTTLSYDNNKYNSITEYVKSVNVNMKNGNKINFKLWQFPRYSYNDKTLVEINKKTSVIIDNTTGTIDKIDKPWWMPKSKIYKKLELAIKTLSENLNNPSIVNKQRKVVIKETQAGKDDRAERDFYAFMHHG